MKRSAMVTTGLVLAAAVSFACASEPDQEFMDVEADYQEMCVEDKGDGELERHPDEECPGGQQHSSSSSLYWYYLGRAFGSPPAYGSSFRPGSHGTTVRPVTGTIARPPASGGFGMSRVSVGG